MKCYEPARSQIDFVIVWLGNLLTVKREIFCANCENGPVKSFPLLTALWSWIFQSFHVLLCHGKLIYLSELSLSGVLCAFLSAAYEVVFITKKIINFPHKVKIQDLPWNVCYLHKSTDAPKTWQLSQVIRVCCRILSTF